MIWNFLIFLAVMLTAVSCGPSAGRKAEASAQENASDEDTAMRIYNSPRGEAEFFTFINLDLPGLETVKRHAESGDYSQARSAYLDFRRNKSTARWHVNPADMPLKASSGSYPEADHILKHIIKPALGAPEAALGEDIDWNFNPVDPSQPHYTKEWTWQQLNRMRQWTTLGEAYWATRDEKYAHEWVAQMTDWVKDNPVPLDAEAGATMAWRTIESGIRMAGSWMSSYFYFLNSPSFTPDAHAAFVTGVIEHAQRLEKITIEFPGRSTNWVAMECNGLGTIGVLFPELKMSGEILKTAFDRLYKEMESQVYPDGAQTELAPGYHQVSRNNFMALANVARMNNNEIPAGYFDRIRKMYEYNLYLMDPSGNLPPFNDSRRVDVTSTLREAYEIWKDPKFLFGATLGKEGEHPGHDSYYFNYAGYYVMRSGWNSDDNCLFFDAGPVGHAHEHEDMLNLYLYSKGRILLTEPGNYSYDLSEWRRYALSTRSHNTILVDGREQHRREFPKCRKVDEPMDNPWISNPVFDYGRGVYDKGYQVSEYRPVQGRPREYIGERDTSVIHTRHVIFLKPFYYLAVDFLDGTGTHRYDAHFHLNAPDAGYDNVSGKVITLRDDSVQLALVPLDRDGMKVEIIKGQKDPILGWLPSEKRAIPTVVFSRNEEAPAIFSTLIFPYTGDEPSIKSEILMKDNGDVWARRLSTPYETATVILKRNSSGEAVKVDLENTTQFETDAALTVIREAGDDYKKNFGFYNISKFREDNLAFTMSPSSSLTMIREANGNTMLFNFGDKVLEVRFTSPVRKKAKILPGKGVLISESGIQQTD